MNRIAALLVALVALVAAVAPAGRDQADSVGRVRFDHRRHAAHLPDCTFCHRSTPETSGEEDTRQLDFARPIEAMCFCHPLPEGSLSPLDTAGPADAASVRRSTALAAEADGPSMAAKQSAVPHELEGRADCLMCHAPDSGMKPAPADHQGRTNDTCTMCHAAPTTTTTTRTSSGPPAVPHMTDGLPGCTSCHKPQGMRPIPADHEGRTDDTCTMCHAAGDPMQARSAESGPDPAVCGLCHAVDSADRIVLPAIGEPTPNILTFRHAEHETRSGAPCDTCHTLAQADSGQPPTMRTCIACHDKAASEGCSDCHLHDARGRLQTELPDGRRLVPEAWWGAVAHGEDWETSHGGAAATDRPMCENCHEQTFCEACHLGESGERRFHGAGWFSMHGPSSRSSDLDCMVCHDAQSTCLSCHRRSGVTFDAPDSAIPAGAGRYHPADWTFGENGHPREARRGLGTCVACHSQGDCFACHSGVSPHGDSWVGGRCSTMEDTAPGLCLQCHSSVPECD